MHIAFDVNKGRLNSDEAKAVSQVLDVTGVNTITRGVTALLTRPKPNPQSVAFTEMHLSFPWAPVSDCSSNQKS